MDEILLQAQLASYTTGSLTTQQKQRTTIRGLINRVQARYDVINDDLNIKRETYEEVDRMWTVFLNKKNNLIKVYKFEKYQYFLCL